MYYSEKRCFRETKLPWVMGAAFVMILVIFSFAFYQQFVLKQAWGRHPESDAGLLITGIAIMLFMGLVFFIFWNSCLELKITRDGITYRFPPYIRNERHVNPKDIESFSVDDNPVIRRYRGWGIKWTGRWRSWALLVNGKAQLRLYLKNGRRLFIGTMEPENIRKAMEDMMRTY